MVKYVTCFLFSLECYYQLSNHLTIGNIRKNSIITGSIDFNWPYDLTNTLNDCSCFFIYSSITRYYCFRELFHPKTKEKNINAVSKNKFRSVYYFQKNFKVFLVSQLILLICINNQNGIFCLVEYYFNTRIMNCFFYIYELIEKIVNMFYSYFCLFFVTNLSKELDSTR